MSSYGGDVVLLRVNGQVLEEPLRRFDDLKEGLELLVPSPTGRAYHATVHWDRNGGFYWRCGSIVGWLAFCEDERQCWICTGASTTVRDDE